jgi:ATP dependent DNA ligase domain
MLSSQPDQFRKIRSPDMVGIRGDGCKKRVRINNFKFPLFAPFSASSAIGFGAESAPQVAMKPERPPLKLKFVEPMYARLLNELPEGKEWLYEAKFDGYRCLAGRDSTGVTLWSRRANLFTNQFPQIARACERLPPGTLILKSSSYA